MFKEVISTISVMDFGFDIDGQVVYISTDLELEDLLAELREAVVFVENILKGAN